MPLGNVFVFGDFNGRTKDLPDFILYYLLSTADMFNFVEKFIVCNFNTFSDHAPLHIELPCCLSVTEGTSDQNACFSKARNLFRWQPELAHFCTENLVTKKDEILNFVDPNVINFQHDRDMCVEKIENVLNKENWSIF